jgi:hypothetical protein
MFNVTSYSYCSNRRPKKDNVDVLNTELKISYVKRKQEQMENKEAYEKALEDMKRVIVDEEVHRHAYVPRT